jgi:hypothetical protein
LKKLEHKEGKLPIDGLLVMLRLYMESYNLIVQFKILKMDVGNTLVLSSPILGFKGSFDESVSPFAIAQSELKRPLKSLLLLFRSGFNITAG